MTKNQAFWTDSNFEPKQNFKFRLLFEFGEKDINQILDIPYQYVVSVDKPRFYVKEKVSKLLNEERKFPTNVTWSPVNIVLIDTVDNRVMNALSKFINERNNPYSFKINNYKPSSYKNTPSVNDVLLQNIRIQQLKNEDSLDGGTQSIEEWILHSPWISGFETGQLNYSNESLTTYSFSISYNWATVEYNNNILISERVDSTAQSVSSVNAQSVPVPPGGRNVAQGFIMPDMDMYFQPGMPISDAYAENINSPYRYKTLLERNRIGARTFALEDSVTVRDENYARDSNGRRILTTDPLDR